MIKTYYRNLKDKELREQPKFRSGSWVHLQSPTQEEVTQIAAELNLEEGHLRDALDPEEVPRLEIEGDTIYVFTSYALNRDGRLITIPFLLVIGPKFLVTVAQQPVPNFQLFTEGRIEAFTTQRSKLFLLLLRHLVGTYTAGLNTLTRQIRSARAGLNVATISNRNFIQFVVIEDALNDFLSELTPTNSILSSLLTGKLGLMFYEDDRDLIEDLELSTRQSIEASKSSLRTIVNIREAYSNIMTNNLNRQIKLLTSLTIILTIPTIVSSFFGMNVPVPLMGYWWAFPLILLGTLAFCSYLVWLFNRNNWL